MLPCSSSSRRSRIDNDQDHLAIRLQPIAYFSEQVGVERYEHPEYADAVHHIKRLRLKIHSEQILVDQVHLSLDGAAGGLAGLLQHITRNIDADNMFGAT